MCRLLQHMEQRGVRAVTPELRAQDAGMVLLPWVDSGDFNPGYLARSVQLLPRQGDRDPWRNGLTYSLEKVTLPVADFDDGSLKFS